MAITAGTDILASDFISTSAGSADSGKGVKINSVGRIDNTFLRGGTGADGALNTTGGTVNIDLASAAVVVKNYTTITVATNNLTFTNPHANGTIIVLKAQGNVTISASIVASSLGAAIGAAGANGSDAYGNDRLAGGGVAGGAGGTAGTGGTASVITGRYAAGVIALVPGAGGAGGGSPNANGGAGGRGGGAIYIECGGAYNFSGTITVAGAVGSNASAGGNGGGGGGGGGGGTIVVTYGSLTSDAGTYTVTGGGGGTGTSAGAGAGGGGGGAGANASGVTGTAGAGSVGGGGGAGGVGIAYRSLNTV